MGIECDGIEWIKKIVKLLDKNLVDKTIECCIQNALKLAYEHVYFTINFLAC
jgi:hypothetical protein